MRIKDPRIGMVLQDRYRVLERLGAGGMGAVYKGEHLKIQKLVAIKFLKQELTMDVEALRRFHREAIATAAIGHPNIIDVTDIEQDDDGSMYMVLEYLEGRDWSLDIRKTGAQPLERVLHITRQVLEGLTAAHELGIVHRDLKPDNVFLCKRGKQDDFVKILDFGISKVRESITGEGALTGSGIALGTPHYMSPEQTTGAASVDQRADIWSVGVLMYEALTGRVPFGGTKISDILIQICMDPTPSLREFRPDLSGEFEAVIERCLEKDPGQRFQTCDELASALESFEELPGSATVAPPPVAEFPASRGDSRSKQSSPSITADVDPLGMTDCTNDLQAYSTFGPEDLEAAPPLDSPSKPSRSLLLGVFAASLIIGAIGVTGWFLLPQAGEVTQRVAPAVVAPPPAALSTGEHESKRSKSSVDGAVVVDRVRIQITTEPANATLTIDDQPVSNPFDEQLLPTDDEAVVVARAPGHRARSKTVTFDVGQAVHLVLHPAQTKARRPRRASVGQPAAPATEPAPAPSPEAEAAPPSTEVSPQATPANPLAPLQRRGLKRL